MSGVERAFTLIYVEMDNDELLMVNGVNKICASNLDIDEKR